MPSKKSKAAETHPLEVLCVFDKLEVYISRIEKKRIAATYTLFQKGETVSNELSYSYEENVFDPEDNSSRNLASLILAQLALNYGLFCREIVFRGVFDNRDIRFLEAMMENTSREIYVNKFLKPNPFLKAEVASLPAIRMDRYTFAKVRFEAESDKAVAWSYWPVDKNKVCVLSSGGKDSLLSYGLMRETGAEVHPFFVNESGRHWFTAINAYKYLQETDPNTGRVWTNSDRVFAWMLRQIPFIRPDFSQVRADDYPIRLWTVAVFLFGVLPLVQKRGIGRLLIGDEYDSTDKVSHEGITHYNGLFDQSRYFDNTLSRFFMKKGWGMSQFSLLRPLSELLIEKILVRRYPELQAQQISCHAAHKEGDRIHPCGKCEKCRRIVGMLTALDEDPARCGYHPDQIRESLASLETRTVKQIGPDSTQLYYMLDQKGKIRLPEERRKKLKPQPPVMNLRFDDDRSPLNAIPTDLRRKLIPIYLEYADGILQRVNRKWQPIHPDALLEIPAPYSFELDAQSLPSNGSNSAVLPSKYIWGELSWPEAEAALQNIDTALLPVGAIEQHGPHLPLDTDSFDAEYLARKVAAACSDPKPLVLPLIPFGVSYHHDDFKGTISLTNETMSSLIYDIGMSLARNGIKKLVIINGHGDNKPALSYAAQMINRDSRIFTCVDTGESSDVDLYGMAETPNDIHAGEIETSTSLATRPHLVKMELAKPLIPEFSSRYLDFTSSRGIPWYTHTKDLSESGTIGDPTKATVEKGRQIWEIMIAHLVAFIEDLKNTPIDELRQSRY